MLSKQQNIIKNFRLFSSNSKKKKKKEEEEGLNLVICGKFLDTNKYSYAAGPKGLKRSNLVSPKAASMWAEET